VTLIITTIASLYKTRVHDVKNGKKAAVESADASEEPLDSR
jgi:hypothetical protein